MQAMLRQKSPRKNGVKCTFQVKNLEHMDVLKRLDWCKNSEKSIDSDAKANILPNFERFSYKMHRNFLFFLKNK